MHEQPKPTGLWAGVRFTEDEARSILAQIDHIATADAARRARWERIGKAREALVAAGSRPTTNRWSSDSRRSRSWAQPFCPSATRADGRFVP